MSGRRTLRRVFVTFLSDFGLQDDFVGTCHGVIKSIAPEDEIIDVTHGISPQHVLQGAAVHELANADYALDIVSRTFHGRDLFAPAAAHLASGVELELLGPPVAVDALARLDLPEPEIGENRIHATVLYIDRFGNVQLNLTREHLQRAEVPPGTVIEIELGLDRYYAVVARTFADARRGDVILYEDSYRNIALAISGGNAAELFGAAPGQEVRIRLQAV